MFVEVRTRNLTVAPKIEAELQDYVSFTLSRFARSIDRVLVRLDDVNGPRGGVDKICRTIVSLRSGGTVVAEGKGDVIHKALAASIARARAQMRSRVQKRARSPRRPAAARIAS